jgi:hypothetical protein
MAHADITDIRIDILRHGPEMAMLEPKKETLLGRD